MKNMNEPLSDTIVAPPESEIRAVYLGLMVVMGLGAIDQSIVATALPRIVTDLGGLAHLSWVVTAYVLASTSTMPLYGKLSDQYGRRPLILFAVALFLAGSVLCGLAQNLTGLIVFRAIQGLGAGGFLPLAQIIIGDLVPPAERARRQGGIVAVFAVTSVLGPLMGGLITDLLSWHWIFYVNLPIGALALFLIGRALRPSPKRQSRSIDYLGSMLLTGSTMAYLLVLSLGGSEWPWASAQVIGATALGTVLLALLLRHVRSAEDPVLPLDLFHNRVFNIGCIVMALAFLGMMGTSVFFPLFFQMVMGAAPAQSGLLTVPMMVGVVIASIVNGRVLVRTGRYKAAQVVGLSVASAAFAGLAWGIHSAWGYGLIEPCILVLGMGLGLVMPNMTIAVQTALPVSRRGVGTAMLTFFRSLGGLVGVTGSGAILAWEVHTGGLSGPAIAAAAASRAPAVVELYRTAIAHVFMAGTVLVALALLVLFLLPEQPLAGKPEAPVPAAE